VSARRFPPPWAVEELDACYVVKDRDGQKLAYVYFEDVDVCFTPKGDIAERDHHVRFVPKADIPRCGKTHPLDRPKP
jgi:hypothetical protein